MRSAPKLLHTTGPVLPHERTSEGCSTCARFHSIEDHARHAEHEGVDEIVLPAFDGKRQAQPGRGASLLARMRQGDLTFDLETREGTFWLHATRNGAPASKMLRTTSKGMGERWHASLERGRVRVAPAAVPAAPRPKKPYRSLEDRVRESYLRKEAEGQRKSSRAPKVPKPVAPAAASPTLERPHPAPDQGSIEDRIRAAYRRVDGDEYNSIKLARLRAQLPGDSANDVNTALRRMQQAGELVLYPIDDPQLYRPGDAEAALYIAGQRRDLVTFHKRR